jgi:hypothetical protein
MSVLIFPAIPANQRLGATLCPHRRYRPTLTANELQVRFDLIEQLGIREIDIWVENVPETWLPYLRKFLASP